MRNIVSSFCVYNEPTGSIKLERRTFIMCGIVGYVGKRQAYPILIKGLHRLEYRGYDSAGLALVNREGVLNVFKSKGKVADLEHFVESKDLDGTIGIAHTRWATHGEPNDINAHPHYSDSGNIALIHNGIIENYRVLKEALIENGYTFKSDTDTEVLVNLIEYIRTSNNCTLLEAVQQALKQVIGAYAIAVVEKGNQDQIIAARRSSPMVIGIGDKEFFLASDAASIVEYTDKIVYVNDGEVVVMDRNHPLKIVTLDNQESKIDIKGAGVIVAGGYGMGSKENFDLVFELADVLGAEVGASRAAVDAGFADHARQVGQTGVTVRPKLYIACGISGQIQHTAGMDGSAMVILINTDPEAPINKIADYAITGDVNEVIPKMIKYYKQNSK